MKEEYDSRVGFFGNLGLMGCGFRKSLFFSENREKHKCCAALCCVIDVFAEKVTFHTGDVRLFLTQFWYEKSFAAVKKGCYQAC